MSRAARRGKNLCRAAKQAIEKNWVAVSEFVDMLEAMKSADERVLASFCVGRVLKRYGHGHFQIFDQNGTEGSAGLCGTLKARKQIEASDTCISPGDIVLIDGGLIKGKVSEAMKLRIIAGYRRLEIRWSPSLFAAAAETDALDDAIEFDRSAEGAEEAAAAAERAAEAAEFQRKWRKEKAVVSIASILATATSDEFNVDAI
jgi:hypothetical protein